MMKHAGSTAALILGIVSILGGFALDAQNTTNGNPATHDSSIMIGASWVLGAIAYRSAKRRFLGERKITAARLLFLEILPIAVIVSVTSCFGDIKLLKIFIALNPANFLLMAAGAFPYFIFAFRQPQAFEYKQPSKLEITASGNTNTQSTNHNDEVRKIVAQYANRVDAAPTADETQKNKPDSFDDSRKSLQLAGSSAHLFQNQKLVVSSSKSDDLYEMVADELAAGIVQKGMWTRLLVANEGDESKTKIAYIKERVSFLEAENEKALLAKENYEADEKKNSEKNRRANIEADHVTEEKNFYSQALDWLNQEKELIAENAHRRAKEQMNLSNIEERATEWNCTPSMAQETFRLPISKNGEKFLVHGDDGNSAFNDLNSAIEFAKARLR